MELKEIDVKTFDKFAKNHEQASFSQTSSWADVKEVNGWNSYFLGLYDRKDLVAATLLLAKKVPLINKKMFYMY